MITVHISFYWNIQLPSPASLVGLNCLKFPFYKQNISWLERFNVWVIKLNNFPEIWGINWPFYLIVSYHHFQIFQKHNVCDIQLKDLAQSLINKIQLYICHFSLGVGVMCKFQPPPPVLLCNKPLSLPLLPNINLRVSTLNYN